MDPLSKNCPSDGVLIEKSTKCKREVYWGLNVYQISLIQNSVECLHGNWVCSSLQFEQFLLDIIKYDPFYNHSITYNLSGDWNWTPSLILPLHDMFWKLCEEGSVRCVCNIQWLEWPLHNWDGSEVDTSRVTSSLEWNLYLVRWLLFLVCHGLCNIDMICDLVKFLSEYNFYRSNGVQLEGKIVIHDKNIWLCVFSFIPI